MKKLLCILMCILCLTGCAAQTIKEPCAEENVPPSADGTVFTPAPADDPVHTDLPDGQFVNRAMYVPYGQEDYVMIDELGSVYTVRFPTDMTTASGEKITPQDLTAGCIVDIYGNGIMLESYPGQYPGVERIVLIDRGDPADADQYASIIDGLYTEPSALEYPPAMHMEYSVEDAVACSQVQSGNYSWERDMGNGEAAAVIACGLHVLQSKNLPIAYINDPTDILLTFPDYAPLGMTCVRWPVSERKTDGSAVEAVGEAIELDKPVAPAGVEGIFDPSLRRLAAEPGYVYLISASWPEGSAEYGFITES